MAHTTSREHDAIQQYLDINGLLLTVLPVAELPSPLAQSVQAADSAMELEDALLVFANVGQNFWTQMKQSHQELPNPQIPKEPVDSFSQQLVTKFINLFIGGDYELLYPSQMPIPLIDLGIHAGWSHSSPLGLTLHKTYGPWYAFRAVIRVPASSLPSVFNDYARQNSTTDSSVRTNPPCSGCAEKPCISSCPANAISASEPFNVIICFEHRSVCGSACASDCPARRACPVGIEYQYDPEQLEYHMLRSLGRTNQFSKTQ